ncbi:MAG: metallophosphoesterase [Planctomycetes bacterium]|nr:metallophosphoesterase [Planctomycetota bacterium]
MKCLYWLAAVVLPLAMVGGCSNTATFDGGTFLVEKVPGGRPWTHLDFNNDPDDFQFVIVSDRTGGHRPGVFEQAVDKVNLLEPEFVICVGDLIEGYTENPELVRNQWDEIDAMVRRLEMPFFYVVGNHDISNAAVAPLYRDRYGSPYYSFVYKNVLFLVVCTEDPPPSSVSKEQAAYMTDALAAHPDVRWTLVFMHKPMFAEGAEGSDNPHWQAIEQALKDRPHTVFAGHWHEYQKRVKHGRSYIQLATTGGMSDQRGIEFGQADQVAWVTMTDQGPRVANLLLDGIYDEDVLTSDELTRREGLIKTVSLTAAPLFAESGPFTEATTRVRLVNPTDCPLTVRAVIEPGESLRADPAVFKVSLAPKTEQEMDVAVRAAQPVEATALAPLAISWQETFELPDGKPLHHEATSLLAVVGRYDCPKRDAPVTVDGKLDEWPALPIDVRKPEQTLWQADSWTGPEDCSMQFAVAYDERYLYLAVRTVDDVVLTEPGIDPWHQDGLSVSLSAAAEPARSASRGDTTFSQAFAPGAEPDKPVLQDPAKMPEGVLAACRRTERGYDTEIAIAASLLDAAQGGSWAEVRLNLAVIDRDAPNGRGVVFFWKPSWKGDLNYPGSGTFRRR